VIGGRLAIACAAALVLAPAAAHAQPAPGAAPAARAPGTTPTPRAPAASAPTKLAPAATAPAQRVARERAPIKLEIDDCPANDPSLTQDQLRQRGQERYERGSTLYLQGDYTGAVRELVGSYCATPFYQILKDVGQAYERSLDYEKAIGYLERYVDAVPADAKRLRACDPDPQVEKENTRRRIEVLRRLTARIFVETTPPGANVTIFSTQRKEAEGTAGEELEVLGGSYEMVVEAPGRVAERRSIEVKIGKPHTYYFALRELEGRLSIQTSPGDARLFLDDKFIGVGRADETVPSRKYTLLVEAPGRIEQKREVEILPNQTSRLQIELAPRPRFARRQLIIAAGVAGGFATGSLLTAFTDTGVAGLGVLVGAGAGILGSILWLPEQVPLGTSNLAITSTIASTIAGGTAARLFTDDADIIEPVLGLSTIVGAVGGYYAGARTKISPGDAALINTNLVWGTAAGLAFSISFDAGTRLGSGLVLSGLGMGAVSGILMTNYFEISRTHAALIDVGGVIGVIGGLAAESMAYRDDQDTARQEEHAANFALGGMAVGLIAAGILTRNLDSPKVPPMTPTLGRVTDSEGTSSVSYGVSGIW